MTKSFRSGYIQNACGDNLKDMFKSKLNFGLGKRETFVDKLSKKNRDKKKRKAKRDLYIF